MKYNFHLLPSSNITCKIVEKLNDNGITVTGAKEKANVFRNYFADVARKLHVKSMPLIDFVWKPTMNFPSRTDKVFKPNPVQDEAR